MGLILITQVTMTSVKGDVIKPHEHLQHYVLAFKEKLISEYILRHYCIF